MHFNATKIANGASTVAMILLGACQTKKAIGDLSVPYVEQARSMCASKLGSPRSALVTMETRQGALPTLGRTFYSYWFADSRSGDACGVDLAADGKEVDAAKLIADEAEARRSRYGSLKPEQYSQVTRLPPGQRVGAAIWVRRPSDTPNFRREAEPYKAKKAFTASHTKSFVARIRQQFPESEPVAIDAAFAVQARLTPSQILSVARWPDVDEVTTTNAAELLAPAWHGTHRMEKAQVLADGFLGKVGVVEFGVWSAMPVLPTVTVLTNGSSNFSPTVQHVQSVVSVLSNTAPDVEPGANPKGQVFYAGASQLAGDAFLTSTAAVSLLLQNYTDAINMSFYFGTPNSSGPLTPTVNPEAFGRYCDEQAYDLGATFVAGAGNNATLGGAFAHVASPANGLNVIGVGMFSDNRTTQWNDDIVDPQSAWQNPPGVYGARSKPDLLAAASDARIVDGSSGSGTSFLGGTSFAAPMVAGTIGLMNSSNREHRGYSASISTLPVEIVRSVLLATALNNVDKVVTPDPVWTFPFVHISDRDGAGGMDSEAALDVIGKNQYYMDPYPAVCPAPQSRAPLQFARFTLRYGQRARGAITYSSLPTALGTPTADIGVMIMQIDPATGATIRTAAWSGIDENNAQMVEFTAHQAGTYQLYVLTATCKHPPQYVGYAWWVGP